MGLCTAAHAQATKLVRLAENLSRGTREFSVAVGNYHVSMPRVARKVASAELLQEYFQAGHISTQQLPHLALQNDKQTWYAIQNFVEQANVFQHEFPKIAERVQLNLTSGAYNYMQHLPQHPGIIYLGEEHDEANVDKEVVTFIRQLSQQYPEKQIYVATEFLSFNSQIPLQENIITSLEDFERYWDREKWVTDEQVLVQLLDYPNVRLIGMENSNVLERDFHLSDRKLTREEYDEILITCSGMERRNRLFSRTLTQLQQYAPDALIVAHGGFAHFSLHDPNSVPYLVPGKNFVIQLITPGSMALANPLTYSLSVDEPSLQMFDASPDAKIIARWKTPSPDYRRLLGNDLSIIVRD